MIEAQAVVTRIDLQHVWIKRLDSGACGGCAQQSSCGSATLAKVLPKREFAVESVLPLSIGEQVQVLIDDSQLLLSSILLYLLPLVLMLLGVGGASAWLPQTVQELWLPEIALGLLLLAFWVIHHLHTPLLILFCSKPQIIKLTDSSVHQL